MHWREPVKVTLAIVITKVTLKASWIDVCF